MILGWRVHANLEQPGVEARQEAAGQQQRDVLVQEHPCSCQASSGISPQRNSFKCYLGQKSVCFCTRSAL